MICPITDYESCCAFAAGFRDDPDFSDPMLCTQEQVDRNLIRSIEDGDRHCVFGVYREDRMTGLFAFLVLRAEAYVEMLVGLSREEDAYREMFAYLEKTYPGFQADFVFNPGNSLLKGMLAQRGAEFEPEQKKLVLAKAVPEVDTSGIELLSDGYAGQYCAMHTRDMYWTAEKVMAAQDRFRTFLALCHGKVVGYLDVTHPLQENEPYDLVVLPGYRRRGYGRKLLARALEENHPKAMMVLLDSDNEPAIRLYTSMGFAPMPHQNNLTAHYPVPGSLS